MKANDTDRHGRRILSGDEERHLENEHIKTHRVALGVEGGRVRFYSKVTGTVFTIPVANWATTHRCGEPIEEISPMAKDWNGRVIERGATARTGSHKFRVLAVAKRYTGTVMAFMRDEGGGTCLVATDALTVIPPTPERIVTTVQIEHPAGTDATATVRGLLSDTDGMRVKEGE